jgi:hypothetical protein
MYSLIPGAGLFSFCAAVVPAGGLLFSIYFRATTEIHFIGLTPLVNPKQVLKFTHAEMTA